MAHDRDYYRGYSPVALLRLAREDGLNKEMAIAIAEHLASEYHLQHTRGQYHFNNHTKGE